MHAQIIFNGKLNDFLRKEYRYRIFDYCFSGTPTVKHMVEALHVPHPEVGKVLVNQQASTLNYLVVDGDSLVIFPVEYTKQSFLDEPRFILDNHLGKLALYMRMLGLDTKYHNNYQDAELARLAVEEKRILLTRDQGLLMHRSVEQGYWLRNQDPKEQIVEVLKHFCILDLTTRFTRCLKCNQILEPIQKEEIINRLEPKTKRYYDEFKICRMCDQIYWKGTHYQNMMSFLDQIIKTATC